MTTIQAHVKPREFAATLREHPEKFRFPGAMLMSHGPKDYIGTAIAITGTLYFEGGHTPQKREAICRCFDEYRVLADGHLAWLWREEPSSGPPSMAYDRAPPLRDTLQGMGENDQINFHYTSGAKKEDASAHTFYVHALRAWKAKKGGGLDVLRFSLPYQYVLEHPQAFQTLFASFARHLQAVHGHGGFGFILSPSNWDQDQATEALLSPHMLGADVGVPVLMASTLKPDTIKTVSWLTAVGYPLLERVGGEQGLRGQLPPDWFAFYDYGAGAVVQAGNEPDIATPAIAGKPALYVLPDMALKNLRTSKYWMHVMGSNQGPALITGLSADEWMQRFDVPETELMAYQAKLRHAPKLKPTHTLPPSSAYLPRISSI